MGEHLPVWNTKTLKAPPRVSFPCSSPELHNVTDAITDANAGLRVTIGKLRNEKFLQSEEFVLARLIYRFNNCFRTQKIVKLLKKIKKCVDLFKELRLCMILDSFIVDLSSDSDMKKTYLPSRQMAEYVQAKLLGGGALLAQTSNYCVQVYIHSQGLLMQGSYIPNMLVFAALASRVRMLSLSTLRTLCACYIHLQQMTEHLTPSSVAWLPTGEVLPSDMALWLREQDFDISIAPRADVRKQQLSDLLSKFSNNDVDSTFESSNNLEEFALDQYSDVDEDEIDSTEELEKSTCGTLDDLSTESDPSDDLSGCNDLVVDNQPRGLSCVVKQQDTDCIDLGEPVPRTSAISGNEVDTWVDYGEVVSRSVAARDDSQQVEECRMIPKKSDVKRKQKSSSQSLTKLRLRVVACDDSQELLKVMKRSEMKQLAKQCGVKGFVRLKKVVRMFGSSESGNDDNPIKFSSVKNLVLSFIKRIRTSMKRVAVDSEKQKKKADKVREKKVQSVSFIIQGPSIRKHFAKVIPNSDQLRALLAFKKEVAESEGKFHFNGEKHVLSVSELHNLDHTINKSAIKFGNSRKKTSKQWTRMRKLISSIFAGAVERSD